MRMRVWICNPWRAGAPALLLAALALVPAGSAMAADGPASSAQRELTLAVVTDANGWLSTSLLYARGAHGGLAHLAVPLRKLRQQYPDLLVLALGEWATGGPWLGDQIALFEQLAGTLRIDALLPRPYDLLRLSQQSAGRTSGLGTAGVATDIVPAPPGVQPHIVLRRAGLRIGVIGLARPGIGVATQLRARSISVADPELAARKALEDLRPAQPPDLVIGLVNGARDSAEEQASAAVAGLPSRNGVHALADGRLPVTVWVTRGIAPPAEDTAGLSVDAVPLVHGVRGLVVAHVMLERSGQGWRAVRVKEEAVPREPDPDPSLVAQAEPSWSATARWLAEPTRAVVSGYNRKADFMDCAGALSHDAVLAAQARGELPRFGAAPALSLLPKLWRFEPLRKRHRGQPLARAHLYRWMTHDDPVLPGDLTGRQIALLLEPYARYRAGWRIAPSLVLHPGGVVPQLRPRATQPDSLRLADSPLTLSPHTGYPVWLSAYSVFGAGGLARKALLLPGQLGPPSALPLRELVFRWMAGPEFRVPAACATFLAIAPGVAVAPARP